MAEENLAGIKIKDSYEGLLHLSDGGLNTTPGLWGYVKPVYDGQGRKTCLSLSSDVLAVSGTGGGIAIDSSGIGNPGFSDYGFIDQGIAGNGIGLRAADYQDGTKACDLYVAAGGNVGIGLEDPIARLQTIPRGGDVANDFTDAGLLVGTAAQGIAIDANGIRCSDPNYFNIGMTQANTTGILRLFTNGGMRLSIDTDGKMKYPYTDPTHGAPASGKVLTCTGSSGGMAWKDGTVVEQGAGSAPYYGCRAWAYYDGINNVLEASGNIANVTQSTGRVYTFTFTTPMPDTNYAVVVGSTNFGVFGQAWVNVLQVKNRTTTTFQVEVEGSGPDGGETHQRVSVAVFK